ncbi:hypothetical protein [Sphingomonas sp. BK069]|uniref:hypothetical protein n=1 Tax=Sphingomonas sp. BK069 TaxID=2586979 RepID=UPI00160C7FBE|nr:hypothetical protein [Sphingomonas sp. BK069]MBB3349876.1 hypothetical protein [Sphingomonas sp. BK069]
MSKSDDLAYFQKRAEAELVMAQRADNAKACNSHYELASRYLDLVQGSSAK